MRYKTRVKVFYSTDGDIEKQINTWLEATHRGIHGIKIEHVNQSQTNTGCNDPKNRPVPLQAITISLFYRLVD